jgi:hypothetical protein
MESVKFKYGPGQAWWSVLLPFVVIVVFTIYLFSKQPKGTDNWWEIALVALPCSGMTFFFGWKFFMPYRRGDTILELDDEKLQYFFKNKTVYWREILLINCGATRNGLEIRLEMKAGNYYDFNIFTQYIAGKDKAIYDTIMEYFEKYRTDDE